MELRMATSADAGELCALRMDYLEELHGPLRPQDSAALRQSLPDYFERHLREDLCACLCECEGRAAAMALLQTQERPPNLHAPSGRCGRIISVYTVPRFRRMGLAGRVVGRLVDHARKMELHYLELEATTAGRKVYERLGFRAVEPDDTPMELEL
ncbi:GNAT family N-acetyltransferase [Harryflintia acetispora]|uniref:Acetyltransferase (GNAT) family protein n=1 Tax=Harryflintia acetispora TaxID=1849041 RepID=A0A9X8UI32_9FIRM|nr:GNAT family N-acetyltransferase [Harryflintia acetispora]TCL41536.1 acetyltransferase (GNAT) family protein [Harryflintia acetispora]